MVEQRRATPAEVRALSHPLRLRVLALCHGESLSNKELADRLHEQPATVLYHVRILVKTGFLEPLPAHPGPRGSTVRPYRATDKSYTIDIGEPRDTGGAKMAAVDAAVAEMRGHRGEELGPLLLFSLRASRDQLDKLTTTLTEVLDRHDEETEGSTEPLWNLLIATYPTAR
jgi:DNA-binding transcriptional ArsR family regulator